MDTSFFNNCQNLDEVKKRYKELALQYHPDRGGSTETMQQINAQYQNIIKNPFFNFTGQTEQQQKDFIIYPEIIDQIISFEGIIIELIGNWIWLSGNTYPFRQQLKQIGFFFAPKKVMWYYRPEDYKCANTSPKTIETIRAKYGSELIERKYSKMELEK